MLHTVYVSVGVYGQLNPHLKINQLDGFLLRITDLHFYLHFHNIYQTYNRAGEV